MSPLTKASDVRRLSFAEADAGHPVQLRGTVIFIEAPGTVFVQDESGGTFFRSKTPLGDLRPGDQVEIQGATFPGLYLPGVNSDTFRVVGHGPLPQPTPASMDDLTSGRYHYQRVAVEGIVRSVTALEENRSTLNLALGSRVVPVRVDSPPPEHPWLDARVRVEGLAAGNINDRRQLVDPYLRVSGWEDVHELRPAVPEAQISRLPASEILRFNASGREDSGHRVRVAGTVLAAWPDGRMFLRDTTAETALAVNLTTLTPLVPGLQVEVSGFPQMDRFSASLADAKVEAVMDGAQPEAIPVTLTDLRKGRNDNDLVTFSATVTDAFRMPEGWICVLQAADRSLRARLEGAENLPEGITAGARVQATGICRVESTVGSGFRSQPETIALWLRSPEDLRLLTAPSWWTAARLAGALGLALTIIAGGLIWIALLRRQVALQTSALRLRIQHEAALEERQRIAREFHDTLEQELAGLSLRMDAATARPLDDKARELLLASRQLVGRIQTEARNLVSGLRDDADVPDLAAALSDLAERHLGTEGVEVVLELEQPLPQLPPHLAHHLRMIAQEAVTNALKHAQATRIILQAGLTTEGSLRMAVIDNGHGFDVAAATHGLPGHFGCMGMRERARKMGCTITWASESGHGTTVEVLLPLTAIPRGPAPSLN